MSYLLRVELPDVPGSLGRLATAIGGVGGDIDAIEIVEHRADGTAVDDVLLHSAPEVMPDSFVSACNALDGITVLWFSRYGAGGHLFLDLEAVEQITTRPETALDELVDLLPLTFRADWGMRVRRGDARVEIVHSTSAAPETVNDSLGWFPLERPARLSAPKDWATPTVLAGAPLGNGELKDEMVAFGRRGGPDVLDSELARLAHLAALAVSIGRAGA